MSSKSSEVFGLLLKWKILLRPVAPNISICLNNFNFNHLSRTHQNLNVYKYFAHSFHSMLPAFHFITHNICQLFIHYLFVCSPENPPMRWSGEFLVFLSLIKSITRWCASIWNPRGRFGTLLCTEQFTNF